MGKEMLRLKVSDNKHFLVKEDGTPFFWMGDTAWRLGKQTPGDQNLYLTHRAKNGFNVVQINLGYVTSDHAGNPAYLENNTDTPNLAFWSNMDAMINRVREFGFYAVLFPMWGGDYNSAFGDDPQKAHRLGKWLGARYASQSHVLWASSGEYDSINGYRLPVTNTQKELLISLARGLHEGHKGTQLMTIHPGVSFTSSLDFHNESWLSFNMLQSGHEDDREAFLHPENHTSITRDYNLAPVKPVLDGEPYYEDTPDGIWILKDANRPRGGADTVRRKAYWAVFAGACGHTYGHNDVYGFFVPKYPGEITPFPPTSASRQLWKESLDAPGALQLKHLRALIETRSTPLRVSDPSMIVSPRISGQFHIQAMRAENGSHAMIYLPAAGKITVNMNRLSAEKIRCSWFDPSTGKLTDIAVYSKQGEQTFEAPGENVLGNDWVLVIEEKNPNG